jgi:hypothetical protein
MGCDVADELHVNCCNGHARSVYPHTYTLCRPVSTPMPLPDYKPKAILAMRACGLIMDKALVFGTKDCRFESCQVHFHHLMCILNIAAAVAGTAAAIVFSFLRMGVSLSLRVSAHRATSAHCAASVPSKPRHLSTGPDAAVHRLGASSEDLGRHT